MFPLLFAFPHLTPHLKVSFILCFLFSAPFWWECYFKCSLIFLAHSIIFLPFLSLFKLACLISEFAVSLSLVSCQLFFSPLSFPSLSHLFLFILFLLNRSYTTLHFSAHLIPRTPVPFLTCVIFPLSHPSSSHTH